MSDEPVGGRYRVQEEVGRGGMGVVLRALDLRLNRVVALKMLPSGANDPRLRHRLASEARIASVLNHPGIATVYDFVEEPEAVFVVYEFVEGRTLRDALDSTRFALPEILEAGIQLAEGLAAAHDRGVTHRDLKPSNVMLTPGDAAPGRLKILDFGLAKLNADPLIASSPEAGEPTVSLQTSAGLIVGTPAYMAPEQLEGEPADARSDIYAFGLVLYEMAAGIHPFRGKTPSSTIANVLRDDPAPLMQHQPALPVELDRLVRKCLRKRPEERYQSVRDALADLRQIRSGTAVSLVAPPGGSSPSLFGRIFAMAAGTPFRTWEVLHIRMCLKSAFLVLLAWFFRLDYGDPVGLVLFLGTLACCVSIFFLCSVLMYTGAFDRPNFSREVRRFAPWVRAIEILSGSLAIAMAAMVASAHIILAAALIAAGLGGVLNVLVFKPGVDRAAVAFSQET